MIDHYVTDPTWHGTNSQII